jgi:hypothetical protein
MRLRWLVCGAALLLGGCQFVSDRVLNTAYFSTTSAGYAGRFRLAYARWPAGSEELEAFMCMRGRAEQFGLLRHSCDDVVHVSYRTELKSTGDDLRMSYFDSSDGTLLCTLKLRAPTADADTRTFPRIRIESTLFGCPRLPDRGLIASVDEALR